MTFSDDINKHKENVRRSLLGTFQAATEEVQTSITEGSEITGAAGQPVDTGRLKGSWIPRRISLWVWRTTTILIYAPIIEDGVGIQLRSSVGGFHSVKQTRTGWPNIVDWAARKFGHDVGGSVTEIRSDD